MSTRSAYAIPRMHGGSLRDDLVVGSSQLLFIPVASGNVAAATGVIKVPIALDSVVPGARILAARALLKTGGAGTKKIHTVIDITNSGDVSIFGTKAIHSVQTYVDATTTYTDVTTEAASAAGVAFKFLGAAADKLYLGFDYKAHCVKFDVSQAADIATVAWKYYKSSTSAFAALTVGDGTNNAKPFDQDGFVSWEAPADWVESTINGVSAYWLEVSVTGAHTTAPTALSILDYSNLLTVHKGANNQQADYGVIDTPVELISTDALTVDILNVPETTPPTNLTVSLLLQWLQPMA